MKIISSFSRLIVRELPPAELKKDKTIKKKKTKKPISSMRKKDLKGIKSILISAEEPFSELEILISKGFFQILYSFSDMRVFI